jgi:hypothetical protein
VVWRRLWLLRKSVIWWGQWMMMRNLVVQRGWCWWVGIELVLCLFEQKLLPLFMLVKDVNGVL